MKLSSSVRAILDDYDSEPPAVRARLAQILNHGTLGGSGRLVILPVDQGFEHGPARSFAVNPPAYDPLYHWRLAIEAGLSAFAAPAGLLQAGAHAHAGEIPTILKLNGANALSGTKDQALTSAPREALRLGAAAIGLTIYPGADAALEMFEEAGECIAEARDLGLASVVWAYPRGGALSKEGETALDVVAYGAQIAALLGAHIIKVKPPGAHLERPESKKLYKERGIPMRRLQDRVAHVRAAAFGGRRLVVFSGGETRDQKGLLDAVTQIARGGGSGSIVGRNTFQRPRAQALNLLGKIQAIYAAA